ncbi:MAG: DUF6498-containing protein [Methanomicrobiaceae archaeon]|nr:DUF6498-containing protein [Methanomicrobiaceae archaeon]
MDPVLHDFPLLSLIVVNLITIALALLQGWDLGLTMFIYWAQSIFIGIFTVISILDLRISDAPEGELQRMFSGSLSDAGARKFFPFYKLIMAGFFTLHYGLFHWGYLGFIVGFGFFHAGDLTENRGILLVLTLFFVNHLYSFLHYRRAEPLTGPRVSALFFRPYARIIPMHLSIIAAGFVLLAFTLLRLPDPTPFILIIFLSLKTYMDAWMHMNKHRQDVFLPG